MPVPIAAAARMIEIAPTSLAAPVEPGKFSRVMPRKETISAQAAKMMPQTWKAFTTANASGMDMQLHREITVSAATRPNLRERMAPLIDSIRHAVGSPHADGPTGLECGRPVAPRDRCMRLRSGAIVHCRCARYDVSRGR